MKWNSIKIEIQNKSLLKKEPLLDVKAFFYDIFEFIFNPPGFGKSPNRSAIFRVVLE